MKINIFSTLILSAALLTVSSCSDNNDDTVFVADANSIVKVNFYIQDEPDVSTFTVKITPRTYPELTPTVLDHDAKIYVQADPAKVETFNAVRGTQYKPLPEGSYSVDSYGIIKAGNTESEKIAVRIDAKGKIEQFTDYMLPVSIVGAEGIKTDDCCQTIYFVFRGSMDASGASLFDRSGWTVVAASSEEPKEGEWGHSGLKEACIDGETNTFWGTDWATTHPEPPHWIVFDLGKECKISGFAIQAREEGSDAPKSITIEVSPDGNTWTFAGEFNDLAARGENRSFFPGAVVGRFVRLTITEVHGGPHVTVSEFNLF